MSVSVLILAHNEEKNLPRCLGAVRWCADVVVIDDFSTDRTMEVAGSFGARVVQRAFDDFASQRNFALDNLTFRHEWVLHLDADEVVTPELRGEIEATLPGSAYDAFRVPSKMIFEGKWLKHAATYPTYQVRLGRKPALRFIQVGHGQREQLDSERIGTLREPYLHFPFSKGLEEWFEKHDRYSTEDAKEGLARRRSGRISLRPLFSRDATHRRRALKDLSVWLPMRPTLRFLYLLVLRKGFLDGRPGLIYCHLMARYERVIVQKMRRFESAEVTPPPGRAAKAQRVRRQPPGN
jgi:glycosyltransferase involved in cell wall biosynthesis